MIVPLRGALAATSADEHYTEILLPETLCRRAYTSERVAKPEYGPAHLLDVDNV